MTTTHIQDKLIEWARWHRSDRNIGYPSRATFDRLRGSAVPEAQISDDTAIEVDAAVGRLRIRCPDQAAVLVMFS